MPLLIILRGPMGSGKSYVGSHLRSKFPGSVRLDLDINANQEVQNLLEIIEKEYVVAELYHGNSHTTDPQWIKAFKDRKFKILSVILYSSLETCIRRVKERGDSLPGDIIEGHYMTFYNNLVHIFNEKAQIKEITIDTDVNDIESISAEISSNLEGL
jgi:predicted ABC-type ATPase